MPNLTLPSTQADAVDRFASDAPETVLDGLLCAPAVAPELELELELAAQPASANAPVAVAASRIRLLRLNRVSDMRNPLRTRRSAGHERRQPEAASGFLDVEEAREPLGEGLRRPVVVIDHALALDVELPDIVARRDQQLLAGDTGAQLGRVVQGERRCVVRVPALGLVGAPVRDAGPGPGRGSERVAADVVLGAFERGVPGYREHARLGGHVGSQAGTAAAEPRGGVDDGSAALLDHVRPDGLDGPDVADDVNLKLHVEQVLINVTHRHDRDRARVVDQRVDPAVLAHRRVDEVLGASEGSQVGRAGDGLAAVVPDLVDDLPRDRGVIAVDRLADALTGLARGNLDADVIDDYLYPLGGEAQRVASPDASAAAGHDDHLSLHQPHASTTNLFDQVKVALSRARQERRRIMTSAPSGA